MAETSTKVDEIQLVAWENPANASAIPTPHYTKVFRASMTRTELIVKYGGDAQVKTYQQAASKDIGKLRKIDNVWHIFVGNDIRRDLQSGSIIIRAQFWTTGSVKAWENNGRITFDVPSPALGPLEVHEVVRPQLDPSDPSKVLKSPSITARPISELLEEGSFEWITQ